MRLASHIQTAMVTVDDDCVVNLIVNRYVQRLTLIHLVPYFLVSHSITTI